MASTQQLHPVPACRELRDERAPRRLRALRTFCAVSVAGWLAFAALVSVTPPDHLPPDVASALALAEIHAMQPASDVDEAALEPALPADLLPAADEVRQAPAAPPPAAPLKVAARLDLLH